MQFPSTPRALRRPAALIATAALLLALSGCTKPAPEEQDEALNQSQQAAEAAAAPAEATPPPGACDASQVQGLVGQAYSEEAAQQAKQDANATQVRMLKPNQPITAEYLGERLNIEVDDKNLVSGVRCG